VQGSGRLSTACVVISQHADSIAQLIAGNRLQALEKAQHTIVFWSHQSALLNSVPSQGSGFQGLCWLKHGGTVVLPHSLA
jgi:hypothetical protein